MPRCEVCQCLYIKYAGETIFEAQYKHNIRHTNEVIQSLKDTLEGMERLESLVKSLERKGQLKKCITQEQLEQIIKSVNF